LKIFARVLSLYTRSLIIFNALEIISSSPNSSAISTTCCKVLGSETNCYCALGFVKAKVKHLSSGLVLSTRFMFPLVSVMSP
jgi:hypothetical protein